MWEMTFTAQDIEGLAAKLDQFEAGLDDRERTLLVAILGLAGEAAVTRRQDEVTGFGLTPPVVRAMVVTTPTDVASPGLGSVLGTLWSGTGDEGPHESISLSYGAISWQYHHQTW
jgi:type VI protein secretion system component Hcp